MKMVESSAKDSKEAKSSPKKLSTRGRRGASADGPAESKPDNTSERKKDGDAKSTTTASASSPTKQQAIKSKFCLNCHKDLTRNIRITCVECISPTTSAPIIELCIECFAVGTEMLNHKKDHKYSVSDCLAFPLVRESGGAKEVAATANAVAATPATTATATTTPAKDKEAASASSDWTAEEELLLLEGIEMFGMGNWKDIAEHVATKSDRKCEAHYMIAYLSTPDSMPRLRDEQGDDDDDDDVTMVDAEPTTSDAAAAAGANKVQPAASTPRKSRGAAPLAMPERLGGSELAGYMPLRGDFDVEYDNEAELILADMEFGEDDHPTERELKLKVIEFYNAKLDERERRKKFVIDRGLLDYKKHQQLERRRPKDERELIAQMRPFARFQEPQEHDEFVNGLVTAMRLRKQILLLQEYRRNGVRTLAEAELYDVEKKKRETEQALQKQRESASYLYESGRPSSTRESSSRTRGAPGGGGANGSVGNNATGGKSKTPTFLVDGTPGSHLLTPKEKELCSKLKLLPKVCWIRGDAERDDLLTPLWVLFVCCSITW